MYQSLIPVHALAEQQQGDCLIFDCRHDLFDAQYGRRAYAEGHIPAAHFLHVDEDLSSPIIAGETGRHPLPTVADFEAKMKSFGLRSDRQVVAYDDKGGGIAARLWWLLRWMGHERVAVLDGGFPAWVAAGLPVTSAVSSVSEPENFRVQIQPGVPYYDYEVLREAQRLGLCLVDARTAARYEGREEPVDPVAGHIPGALNLPWPGNLQANGLFKTKEELKSRFLPLQQETAPVVFYCGSGVTACHNILAFHHATGQMPALYPGSWSEWIVRTKQKVD